MVDPKVRKSYREFQKHLSKIKVGKQRWVTNYSNESVIYEYWDSISWAEKKRIVSCPSWNNYPSEFWGSSQRSKRPYGPLLAEMVKFYSLSSPKDRELFVKHSQGVFSVIMFDIGTHREKLRIANRLARSKDKRIKGRALSVLPVDKIWWALHDPDYSARNKAVTRIGFSNCYKELLPTPSSIGSHKRVSWWERRAILLADYEDVVEHINNITEDTPDYLTSILMSKVPKKDILYYLDKQKNGNETSRIIQMMMGVRES